MRKHLKGSEYDGVFLNEDLTKSRSKLLFEARMKVKGYFLKGAWSADGRLFIKDHSDKVHKLTSSDVISEFASKTPIKPKPRHITLLPNCSILSFVYNTNEHDSYRYTIIIVL